MRRQPAAARTITIFDSMGVMPEEKVTPGEVREAGAVLSWEVHPASTRPLRLAALLIVLSGLLWVIYYMLGSVGWVAFSAALLLVSLRQYFLPTRFRLTEETVSSRFLWFEQTKAWDQFKSFYVDRNGVLLSPFPGPSRLENFRGFYLIGAGRQPGVLEFIRKKLERQGAR